MALLFEIRLTAPQIDLLRSFLDFSDGKRDWPGREFGHFIVHVKPLLREGLINHTTIQVNKSEQKQVWEITAKGRALMQVIDYELMETVKGRTLIGRGQAADVRRLPKGAE